MRCFLLQKKCCPDYQPEMAHKTKEFKKEPKYEPKKLVLTNLQPNCSVLDNFGSLPKILDTQVFGKYLKYYPFSIT